MFGLCHIRGFLIGVEYLSFSRLDGENLIKTDLQMSNLWTGQLVSYESVVSAQEE